MFYLWKHEFTKKSFNVNPDPILLLLIEDQGAIHIILRT